MPSPGTVVNGFQLGPQRWLVLVADVSGHDLKAGFISAFFQGVVRALVEKGTPIQEVFAYFNRFLLQEWSNAQHPPAASFSVAASISTCALVIDLAEMAPFLCPELGIGGEMIDLLAASDRRFDRPPFPDVGSYHLDLVRWKVIDGHTWAFEDANGFALLCNKANQVAANEPGTSGDERRHGIPYGVVGQDSDPDRGRTDGQDRNPDLQSLGVTTSVSSDRESPLCQG